MSIFNKRRKRFLCKGISTLSAISCVVCQTQIAFAIPIKVGIKKNTEEIESYTKCQINSESLRKIINENNLSWRCVQTISNTTTGDTYTEYWTLCEDISADGTKTGYRLETENQEVYATLTKHLIREMQMRWENKTRAENKISSFDTLRIALGSGNQKVAFVTYDPDEWSKKTKNNPGQFLLDLGTSKKIKIPCVAYRPYLKQTYLRYMSITVQRDEKTGEIEKVEIGEDLQTFLDTPQLEKINTEKNESQRLLNDTSVNNNVNEKKSQNTGWKIKLKTGVLGTFIVAFVATAIELGVHFA